MSAEDKEIVKLKKNNSGAIIASAGYADSLMEELTVAGLTLIDTRDESLISRVADVVYNCRGVNEGYTAIVILQMIRERQARQKKIGKVPGKKPKKVKS